MAYCPLFTIGSDICATERKRLPFFRLVAMISTSVVVASGVMMPPGFASRLLMSMSSIVTVPPSSA